MPDWTSNMDHHRPWDETYTFIRLLGQGGSADVFLANRKIDGQQVAIKVPRGVLVGGATLASGLVEEFKQEVEKWRELKHGHIVPLFDYGLGAYPWLAMEYMAGGTLTPRLGKLPPKEVLGIFVNVCAALAYAHEGGVVHRDIKPDNILFTKGGIAKVSDWGLARQLLFQSVIHEFSGTPLYSAPEQIEPDRFGRYRHAGDVFQVGMVLYQALTGQHPFLGLGERLGVVPPWTVIKRLTDTSFQVIAPSVVRPGLPQSLDDAVLQALRRVPTERQREVWMIGEALERLLALPQVSAPSSPVRGPKPAAPVPPPKADVSAVAAEARALFDKALRLGQAGRSEEEIKTCDEVVRRFGERPEPAIAEQVAKALFNKGYRQGVLGRSHEEVKTYDDVVRRFGERAEPAIAEQVAGAVVNKGYRLVQLGRSEEAIGTYDEVVRRFGERTEPAIAARVAMALVNMGYPLGVLGRSEEAIRTEDEVVRRFGERPEPTIAEQVATALVNRGIGQRKLGRPEEAVRTYDEVVRVLLHLDGVCCNHGVCHAQQTPSSGKRP